MSKKICKNCIYYLENSEWKADASSFTGECTFNPPQFISVDKKTSPTGVASKFAMTNEVYSCSKHTTKVGKMIERWYPVIYVAAGSLFTTCGAYIIHILTKP